MMKYLNKNGDVVSLAWLVNNEPEWIYSRLHDNERKIDYLRNKLSQEESVNRGLREDVYSLREQVKIFVKAGEEADYWAKIAWSRVPSWRQASFIKEFPESIAFFGETE